MICTWYIKQTRQPQKWNEKTSITESMSHVVEVFTCIQTLVRSSSRNFHRNTSRRIRRICYAVADLEVIALDKGKMHGKTALVKVVRASTPQTGDSTVRRSIRGYATGASRWSRSYIYRYRLRQIASLSHRFKTKEKSGKPLFYIIWRYTEILWWYIVVAVKYFCIRLWQNAVHLSYRLIF